MSISSRYVSGAVALLEFLLAATRAWIVPAYILERVAHRILMVVIAVRAVYMFMFMCVVMIIVMVAVGAVDMRFFGHGALLRDEIAWNDFAVDRVLDTK